MLICHNCGTLIENRAKQCHHCHNTVFATASFRIAESTIVQPLKIEVETHPSVLNRLIAKELIQATSKGNGHSSASTSSMKLEKSSNEENYFLSLPVSEAPQATLPNSVILPTSELAIKPTTGTVGDADFFAQMPYISHEDPGIEQLDIKNTDKAFEKNKDLDTTILPAVFNSNENNKENSANWFLSAVAANRQEANTEKSNTTLVDNGNEQSTTGFTTDTIHRRSFAGDFPKKSANPFEKSATKGNTEAEAMVDQLKSRFFSGIASGDPKSKIDKAKLLDYKKSWPIYLSAIVLIFLLFKGFEAFCAIGQAVVGNLSNASLPNGQNNPISGRWQFAAKWGSSNCEGQMLLHQNGDKLYGQGRDSIYGNYQFSGSRDGNHLDLLKQYYSGNTFVGHPIEMHGDIDPGSKPLFASGNFSLSFMQGGKWRGKPVVIAGFWEAEMIQPLIDDNNSPANIPQIQKRDERPAAAYGGFAGSLSKYGSWIAGAIVVFGTFVYWLARALIGPNGWIGIWDKQKYVPAQFMKEHKQSKALLSKPIVPGSLPLGQRWEWKPWQKPFPWIPRYLAIPPDMRANSPHVLILGGSEKGKSRLMANMITHDIESADRAIVLVDSDGDLVDLLLHWVSAHPKGEQFAKRIIVVDPTSHYQSPSFNPLQLPDDHDLQNAASSIVNGFKAIYHEPPGSQNQWSPQTAHILRNSAMLLMANGKTLLDLPTLLQDNDFRDILLEKIDQKRKEKVEYSTLLETWGQYKRLARTEQWINWYEPILNRVGPTLINQRLRPILTQPQGDINLKQIIAEKKILLVKIPKGQLHEDANLLGSLIVTGMKQAAISLCSDNKITDRTTAMYLDEFDHFIEKETLDAITTETKKFQLGFIGATKTLQHLPEDWRNQIEANMGTMCVFALTKKDGDMLAPRMFRVSGRRVKHLTLMNIFNPINTSPQFDFISDEEKFNTDRILAQPERGFYAYRVGAEAGVFRMHSVDFLDIPDNQINASLIELMYNNR